MNNAKTNNVVELTELQVFKSLISKILYKPYTPSTDKVEELMKLVPKECDSGSIAASASGAGA